MKVADYIANFLYERGVRDVFAISGASDLRILDAIARDDRLRYICPHHEQAGVMAALTYHRLCGRPAVMLVTAGPGATNTITGVASALLDSIPCIILAGQEKNEFLDPASGLRGKGVQGLDMVSVAKPLTKYAFNVSDPKSIRYHLEKAFYFAYEGRPGPVWLDIPQDIQTVEVDHDTMQAFVPETAEAAPDRYVVAARKFLDLLQGCERPLLWAGNGIRLAGAADTFARVLDKLGIPSLAAWNGADLVPDDHPLFAGRAGTYGQRWANLTLQNCDFIAGLGTRLAIPQRGYVDSEFARAAKKVVVEIDPAEIKKWKISLDLIVEGDVGAFLSALEGELGSYQPNKAIPAWRARIADWRKRYPTALPEYATLPRGKVNSYHFIDRLSDALAADDVICTDMGTSLTCTHATIRLKKGQRLVTSTGLGEMGFGLPGALGAAFGSGRRTIFIGTEGSLMMNLQELQTLVHHKLNVKIFILNNNGYLTIKHTEKALFGERESGCGPASGVTFPKLDKVAAAFELPYERIDDSAQVDAKIQQVLKSPGAVFCDVFMPEDQLLIPKSAVKTRADGSLYSPPLEDMYPFLPRDELAANMIVPMLKGD